MTIDILTPVFEPGGVLETCIKSVRDQGDAVRHVIQDGASRDEKTQEILRHCESDVVSEPDSGMYDALNRALTRCTGDVIGHLNADEQYLPGILERVRKIFTNDEAVDVVCGDMILTDAHWNPLSYRRSVLPPAESAGLIPLPVPTCGMFIRRKLFQNGLAYRADLKAIADAVLVEDLIQMGARWHFDRVPYAAFSLHGTNLSNCGVAEKDRIILGRKLAGIRSLALKASVWMRRLLLGSYTYRKGIIWVYTTESKNQRAQKSTERIGWDWPVIESSKPR